MVTIAIAAEKGGVAKTTLTLLLAAALTKRGEKVLTIDADSQGNFSDATGQQYYELLGLGDVLLANPRNQRQVLSETIQATAGWGDVLPPGRTLRGDLTQLRNQYGPELRLKKIVQLVKTDYDFILIDTPAQLTLATTNAFAAAEYVIIPLQTEEWSYLALQEIFLTLQMIKDDLNPEILIASVVPTKMKATNANKKVHQWITEWVTEKLADTLNTNGENLFINQPIGEILAEPFAEASCYAELATLRIPYYKYPKVRPKHQSPIDSLVDKLMNLKVQTQVLVTQ